MKKLPIICLVFILLFGSINSFAAKDALEHTTLTFTGDLFTDTYFQKETIAIISEISKSRTLASLSAHVLTWKIML